MEYRLGNSDKVYDHGETVKIECPKCGNTVNFSVFTNFDMRLAVKFPPVAMKNVYFLVCPRCAGAFTVDGEKGKTFKKGEKLAIGNYDLKELEKFDK